MGRFVSRFGRKVSYGVVTAVGVLAVVIQLWVHYHITQGDEVAQAIAESSVKYMGAQNWQALVNLYWIGPVGFLVFVAGLIGMFWRPPPGQ